MKRGLVSVRHQRGFSLVELMLALALGLLLVAAISSVYLGSSQSYRTQTEVSQVQEGGRFSMVLMAPIVRLAGYLPYLPAQADPSQVFNARTNKLAIYGFNQAEAASRIKDRYPRLDQSTIAAGTEVLVIAYAGSDDAGSGAGRLKSCLGRSVDAAHVAVNLFFISEDGNGARSLSCYDNISPVTDSTTSASATTSVQPLVSGITDMRMRYGVDTHSGTNRNASLYLSATEVTAAAAWKTVASVQIELTADSTAANENRPAGSAGAADGAGIRHRFQTVLSIRNPLGA